MQADRRTIRAAPYRVPDRFNVSGVLAITTTFALLFGLLHYHDAPPLLYAYLSLQAVLICLLQMAVGRAPRSVSAAAGAVLLPVCWFAFVLLAAPRGPKLPMALCLTAVLAPLGALLGYCTGAVAAGVFLVLDKLADHDRPDEDARGPDRRRGAEGGDRT